MKQLAVDIRSDEAKKAEDKAKDDKKPANDDKPAEKPSEAKPIGDSVHRLVQRQGQKLRVVRGQ